MFYKPEWFSWKELVPPEVFQARGDKCCELFTIEILETADELRELLGVSMTVNDWAWGGNFKYRGFRPTTYYKGAFSLSQHIRGNAIDFDARGYTADEVRELIKGWKREGKLAHLTGLEEGVNWVHVDCRPSGRLDDDGLFCFKP